MTPLRHVRTHLVRGLLIVLPTIITLWLLRILFGIVRDNVTPVVVRMFAVLGIDDTGGWRSQIVAPLLGVVLTLVLVYLIGLLTANLIGARILGWLEAGILKIPLVKGVYGAARQLLDALGAGGKGAFSRVVLVEYPRPSVFTLGFVTNESRAQVPVAGGAAETVMVFFPTAPNPTSGWLALVPVADLLEVDLTIEEGVKLIVSGGIVTPDALSARIRRPPPARAAP